MGKLGDKLSVEVVEASASYLLRRASQRFKEAAIPVLKHYGLSTLELTTMNLIHANEGCILRTLAEAAGVEPPAMNRIVNSLEDKKLASRHKSDADSRYTFFKLTDIGKMLSLEASVEVQKAEQLIFAALTADEQKKLLSSLRKFR